MGPEPDGFKASYPLEWCPVYYHKADTAGIGFDRSSGGTGATQQYREPYCSLYDNPSTCPERYLLWFHHLPWTYRMLSGRTLWEEMQYRYERGVDEVKGFIDIWQQARPYVDEQRWQEVDGKLHKQLADAQEWQRVCVSYFGTFANR
jgi:alpha-glucuronidase